MLPAETILSEWLEPDGLGGFASATTSGPRSRRYHALLLVATTPPTGRMVLVNGMEVWATTAAGTYPLSTQLYPPNVRYPDGDRYIASFSNEPWPTWVFRLPDGTEIEQTIAAIHGSATVTLVWRIREASGRVSLTVRPLLSGRDQHALHKENGAFSFAVREEGSRVCWQPYASVPAVVSLSNGLYKHSPLWYRDFLYTHEQERGLDFLEDLGSPGVLEFELGRAEAVWILTTETADGLSQVENASVVETSRALRRQEWQRRSQFVTSLERAADAYLVRRGAGKTIIAGYPWFTDWGRDTFISLRGLCLATGRLEEARQILLAWAATVDQGMVPNRFHDADNQPEFNSVDASLWYVIAVGDFLSAAQKAGFMLHEADHAALQTAVQQIVSGYASGTRYGIRLDNDGLLACGETGMQLTWMDARVGSWVVTPRIGKPVEVQALWLNALEIAAVFDPRWRAKLSRGRSVFVERFRNHERGGLYDVVDVDHVAGTCDDSVRPNQLFCVGGLPQAIVTGELAREIVDIAERELLTPMGPRSLAPGSASYAPRYAGTLRQRDGAYHQGTVWPWLMGPFVEAWVRVRGATPEVKREATVRFLDPLLPHLEQAGLGHLSEIADAEPPYTPRGCPWQAWSLGELLRLSHCVLAE